MRWSFVVGRILDDTTGTSYAEVECCSFKAIVKGVGKFGKLEGGWKVGWRDV